MRTNRVVFAIISLGVMMVGCSGDGLSPAPGMDKQFGGSTHGSDTAVVSGPKQQPEVPPVVSSFALSGVVSGRDVGTDTSRVSPVSHAAITLVKVGSVTGDTLSPSVTVGSTTTDAQGAYRFENLAPAYYRVDVVAPAGSPFANATSGIGPARQTEVTLNVTLERK